MTPCMPRPGCGELFCPAGFMWWLLAASAAMFMRAFMAERRCECIGSYVMDEGVLLRVVTPLTMPAFTRNCSSETSGSGGTAMAVRCVFWGSRSGITTPRRPLACLRFLLHAHISTLDATRHCMSYCTLRPAYGPFQSCQFRGRSAQESRV